MRGRRDAPSSLVSSDFNLFWSGDPPTRVSLVSPSAAARSPDRIDHP
ncbi:hypothetical protein ACIQ7D_29345 [Streptomyces sp. NPDC096310]